MLLRLYDLLREWSPEKSKREKEELFEKVFKKSYNAKADSKLRDLKRRLKQQLEDYLVPPQTVPAFPEQARELQLIEQYVDFVPADQLERHIEKLGEALTELADPQYLIRLREAHIRLLAHKRDQRPERYAKMRALYARMIALEEQRAAIAISRLQARMTALDRQVSALTQQAPPEVPTRVWLLALADKTPLMRYYHASMASFQALGRPETGVFESAMEALNTVENSFAEYQKERSIATANLGLTHLLSGAYALAAEQFALALSAIQASGEPAANGFLYNYVSALSKCGRYTEALNLLEAHWERILQDERTRDRFLLMRSMLHCFTEDAAAAREYLPTSTRTLPESELQYARLLFIIEAMLRDDCENALRDAENFKQALADRTEEQRALDIDTVLGFFIGYLKAKLSAEAEQPALFAALSSSLDAFRGQSLAHQRDYLPLVWLTKRLELALAN